MAKIGIVGYGYLGSYIYEQIHSVLVADPSLDVSLIELKARGQGVKIDIRRANPM